jgi:hypothetical protein
LNNRPEGGFYFITRQGKAGDNLLFVNKESPIAGSANLNPIEPWAAF